MSELQKKSTSRRRFLSGVLVVAGTAGGVVGVNAAAYAAPKVNAPMADGTYRISSNYGPRGSSFHHGVDLAASSGTAIYAAAGGKVVAAGPANGFGNWIVIDHVVDGKKVSTVYGHMYASGVLVKKGQIVTAAQRIGKVGSAGQSSGPHLHFEVWPGGRLSGGSSTEPVDWLLGHDAKTPR